jgi:LysR family transcriptional regulator, low CO2-responsive transcriptional regulator
MKNVTFRQIRVFTEVARHLNFARAAEALHLTPPAVTMQVKELEAAIDLTLFDRQGRQVSLTTAGEYFLVYARRLQATLKDAEDAMARLRKLETGLLTVGIVSTAKYFVPRLLVRFQDENPGVEVKLRVSTNREQLVALLHANEVDLAVMGRTPKEIAMRSEPFAAHPLVFVAPPGHPVGRRGHPPLELLAPYPFIVREAASGTRGAMDRFFAERQFTPRIGMEMGSNESIKQAVMAGMGLGFLSLHTVGLELRAGALQLIHVEGSPVMRSWFIAHRQSRVLSPAAEAFRYFIMEHGEAFLIEHDRPLLDIGPANPHPPT